MKNITSFKENILIKGKIYEILEFTLKKNEDEFCFNELFIVQF